MEFKAAQSQLRRKEKQIHLAVLIIVFLVISNVILSGLLVRTLHRQLRTIIPATLNHPITFSETRVDASYLQQMARLLIAARLNVTPDTVGASTAFLLEQIEPAKRHHFLPMLRSEARAISAQNISSSFYISILHVDAAHLTVISRGTLKRWVDEVALPPKKVTYRLVFSYREGLLKLRDFTLLTSGADHD